MNVEKAFYVVILALVLMSLALCGLVLINTIVPDITYIDNTSINETVKKIDVQLNFQVYVNDKLVVDKWNNGLTKNFIGIIIIALAQTENAFVCTAVDGVGYKPFYFEESSTSSTYNDKIFVRLGTSTYNSSVAYDIYDIASSSYKSFEQFPTSSTTVGDNNVTITYTWEWTSDSSFTFYEVGIYRRIARGKEVGTGSLGPKDLLLIYEDVAEGVDVDVDDVVKIVVKFICERNSGETFTVNFASEFLDKILKEDYPNGQDILIWSEIQYRYVEIGKDCFSLDCASDGEICSTNYVEIHHESRTHYTNADKTQCTIELKATYTPDSTVNVKEICWGFSNTNVGYCKKFDTTLEANTPYVIKVLLTFPTG